MRDTDQMERPCLSSKVIPAQYVRVGAANPARVVSPQTVPASRAGAAEKLKEPKITLHKEGDAVKSIEIQCTCGAVIKLDCEYGG